MRFKIAHQLPARHFCLNNLIFSVPARNGLFNNPHSQPSGFYWSHECSWTLTSANRMQVSNIQSYDHNRKHPGLRQGLKVLCLRSQRWTGGGSNHVPTYLGQLLHLYSPWWYSLAIITTNRCYKWSHLAIVFRVVYLAKRTAFTLQDDRGCAVCLRTDDWLTRDASPEIWSWASNCLFYLDTAYQGLLLINTVVVT